MTNSEKIVYSIFGVTNKSTQDMAYAVDRMAELLFDQNQKLDGIKVGKAIYPVVAERAERPVGGGSRNIQRLTRACWDAENRKNLLPFLGRDMPIRVPKELLFHLAYYSRTGIPYVKAMKHHAAPPV